MLNNLPLLIILTLFMLGAPFYPEPHLVEKARMLADGTLTRPLDIFDVFWHLLPAGLLVAHLLRRSKSRPPSRGVQAPVGPDESQRKLPSRQTGD